MVRSWIIAAVQGTHPQKKLYKAECVSHYRAFYEKGIRVDVVDLHADLSKYKLVIAPMLYIVNEERAQKIRNYIAEGGCFVTTFYTGWAGENTLANVTGFPGYLRDVTGIWVEDMDVLNDGEHLLGGWVEGIPQTRKKGIINIRMLENELQLAGTYKAHTFCDQIHLEGAKVLALYDGEFYRGTPCLTVNAYGQGEVYYLGTRTNDEFRNDFYAALIERLKIIPPLKGEFPEGVIVVERGGVIFLLNFNGQERVVTLTEEFTCYQTGRIVKNKLKLEPYQVMILQRP